MFGAATRSRRLVDGLSLPVLTGKVAQAGDGWMTADAGVEPVIVVGVQPSTQAAAAAVGSLTKNASQPHSLGIGGGASDLAVLSGAVRADELPPDAELGADALQGVPVSPGVVDHQSLDAGDAVVGKVSRGPGRNPAQSSPFSSGQTSE